MKIFYFTSTGNNLHIAKRLGGQLYSIPKILKEGPCEFEADKIGIIFPCYYFGPQRLVEKFLKKVQLKTPYLFAIMSYGNFSAAGLNHFFHIARKSNIQLSYLNEILMVNNYLPIFDIEKQIKNIPHKNIEENLTKIIADINASRKYIKKKGSLKTLATFFGQLFYGINVRRADKKFFIEDTCNSCKTCEKVCPVDNIKVLEKPTFLHHCEECLACIHHCPQNAIRLKNEKGSARFINENVSLREIITANS